MRCWLISIGLSGPEFKLIRKLMTAIPGNAAFSRGFDPRKVAQAEAAAQEAAAEESATETEAEAAGDDLPGEAVDESEAIEAEEEAADA